MSNLELAKKYEDYIISMRRYFHENPELSDHEDKTIDRISEELTGMGIEHVVIPHGGILATIKGPAEKDNGKAVLLRADVDALPVQETDTALFDIPRCTKSKNDGVMHACGHDGHIAMLLGAAHVLLERKDDIEGTVYLCFERGEEMTGNVKYIFKYMDEQGISEKITTCYGTHLLSTLETGKVAANDTNMMAGAIMFDVTLKGRGGHGSRPDLSLSPLDAFAAIYQGMEGLRMRRIDPYTPLTCSIGRFEGGKTWNVIPDECRFAGSVRFFDRDKAAITFYNEFKAIIEHTAEAYNCDVEFNSFNQPGFAVVNDPECAQFARKVIREELGDAVIDYAEPWMASESFSEYIRQWPGVFCFIGMKNDAKGVGAAHHNRFFDIDEDVLVKGAVGASTYAIEFLKRGPDNSGKPHMKYVDLLKAKGAAADLEALYGIKED
ncbi:MAG: amidohydrolase [Solobacterium sp.]|nr:amidohydrolase [Solobacterium sp.]MBQ1446002.1 amidohydrolase [Solobacterium sp.]